MPDKVLIFDTTLRDGEQSPGASMNQEEKLSIARLLEVAYRIHLIPNTEEGYMNEWESILQASGIKQEYLNKYKEIDKYKIEYFLLFDLLGHSRKHEQLRACLFC